MGAKPFPAASLPPAVSRPHASQTPASSPVLQEPGSGLVAGSRPRSRALLTTSPPKPDLAPSALRPAQPGRAACASSSRPASPMLPGPALNPSRGWIPQLGRGSRRIAEIGALEPRLRDGWERSRTAGRGRTETGTEKAGMGEGGEARRAGRSAASHAARRCRRWGGRCAGTEREGARTRSTGHASPGGGGSPSSRSRRRWSTRPWCWCGVEGRRCRTRVSW
jgi:hypothetical protein